MKTRRPISINNSLVHGICNYSCRLCGINKTGYNGPREFQPFIVTKTLIQRVLKSAESGIHVRYIANSGDGEATLHPEFKSRIEMFGDMLREWDISAVPPPEVSVVTNGLRLNNVPGIMDSFISNKISLIISLPTVKPESYGLIMMGDSKRGEELLSRVLPGVEKAMEFRAKGQLSKLMFHISPPEIEIIRNDFPETIDYLTRLARGKGLGEIELVLFPATSNRSGLIRNTVVKVDMYKDLFRRYNGHDVNGVKIRMKLVLKRFFSGTGEIADLVRSFRFPCLWNANFFIAADGSSICCNDQSVSNPLGNILYDSIDTLMQYKEQYMPGQICAGCNQSPNRLKGSAEAVLFASIVRFRMKLAAIRNRDSAPGDSILKEKGTIL
jgi:sulfatase maturation enzyme AslB (radical SAM superfamily)